MATSARNGASSTRAAAVADLDPGAGAGTEEEQSAEELLDEAGKAFCEIFPIQPTRDIFAGFWSGIRCVFSGVFIGLAGVIAQPIEGLRSGGLFGFVRGLLTGFASGLAFSVMGVGTGAFQAIRGALATPRAICMKSKGLRWDQNVGDWAEPALYSLPAEVEEVFAGGATEEDDEEDRDSKRKVVDTFYYDQLGLTPKASQRQIRQAYFLQSKRWHPDKTQDPKAKERFQAISEAYQVLSDPQRRRAYDSSGRESVGDGFVDPRVFFTVLLGVDTLEPYIGRIRIVEMFGSALIGAGGNADDEGGDGDTMQDVADAYEKGVEDEERSQRQQLRRQVRLAMSLAQRLDREGVVAADGPCEGSDPKVSPFQRGAENEAQALIGKDALVRCLLEEIGWIYKNRASLFLAKTSSSLGSFAPSAISLSIQRGSHETMQQVSTARLALRSFFKLRKIVDEVDDMENPEENASSELSNCISSALPTFMDTLLGLAANDISGTLGKVIDRVLNDSSIDADARLRRVHRLRELGCAFLAAARCPGLPGADSSERVDSSSHDSAGHAAENEDERSRKRFQDALLASMSASGSGAASGASR